LRTPFPRNHPAYAIATVRTACDSVAATMSDSKSSPSSLPPHAQIIQMGTAYWVSRFVYTAANMRLADHLAGGPRSASELAAVTGANPRALHRFMRTLTSLGILTQDTDRFALTPLGAALKSDATGAARATVLTMAGPTFQNAFAEFQYSLETGKTAMEKVFGMPAFDYLAQHPQEAAQFSEAMVGIHGAEPPAVAAAYDFSRLATIVDVGGATGNMLGHILKRHSQPRGILFDRPRQLLRQRSRGRGRLYPVAHHSRLERGSVPDDSRQLPQSDEVGRQAADRRVRATGGRHAALRKDR